MKRCHWQHPGNLDLQGHVAHAVAVHQKAIRFRLIDRQLMVIDAFRQHTLLRCPTSHYPLSRILRTCARLFSREKRALLSLPQPGQLTYGQSA